jgi:putative protease
VPSEEPELSIGVIENIKAELDQCNTKNNKKQRLSVKVNNFEQAKLCIELGVDRVYIPCEVFLPDTFLTEAQLEELKRIKGNTKLYLDLPQMTDELWFDRLDQYLDKHGSLFDGLMVSNLGAVRKYAGKYPMIANYNMNLYNHKSIEFYHKLGVSEFTPSIECKSNELAALLGTVDKPMELMAHGPIKVMYLDHNLYDYTKVLEPIEKADNKHVDNSILVMMTDKGENPVYIDQTEKNHLYSNKELCFLPLLDSLNFESLAGIRIEGQTYKTDELKYVVEIYKKALADKTKCMDLFSDMKSSRAGFTLGALSYKYSKE